MKSVCVVFLVTVLWILGCKQNNEAKPSVFRNQAPIKLSFPYYLVDKKYIGNMKDTCSREKPDSSATHFDVSYNELKDLDNNIGKLKKIVSEKKENFKDYFYQIMGMDIKGERYIYINAFVHRRSRSEEDLTKPIISCDGGKSFFGVFFNLKTKEFEKFEFDGSLSIER
jgi:hypothetical protein